MPDQIDVETEISSWNLEAKKLLDEFFPTAHDLPYYNFTITNQNLIRLISTAIRHGYMFGLSERKHIEHEQPTGDFGPPKMRDRISELIDIAYQQGVANGLDFAEKQFLTSIELVAAELTKKERRG